jgi:hypothetical protein
MAKGFTDREQDYIRLRAEGYPKSKCAELAGYSFPKVSYVTLEKRESVKKAIIQACTDKIGKELLPKAIRVFHDLLDPDSAAPSAVRLKAAAYVTDKALELQQMASARDVADKNPLDMTSTELELFIMRGRMVVKRESAKADLGIIDVDMS